MPYREKSPDRLYYSMGMVAKLLKQSQVTIRWWTDRFNVSCKRNSHGNRLYKKEGIKLLRVIWYLRKVEKYSVAGTQRQLELNKNTWLKKVKFNVR